MKKFLTLAVVAILFAFSSNLQAQKFSGLDKSPMDMALYRTDRNAPPAVRVIYSRPQLKGRDMATLAPKGKVWRTGANESTEITFYQDVNFGGESVTAGTYALFTIPGEESWTVILNKTVNQWGAYAYDKSADVARISVPSGSDADSLEAFSIAFNPVDDGIHLVMGWGTTRVAVPITM